MRRYQVYGWMVVALFCMGGLLYAKEKVKDKEADKDLATANDIQILKRTGKAFSEVAKKALPAVVFIQVEKNIETGRDFRGGQYNDPYDFFGDEFMERFFRGRGYDSAPRRFKQMGQGSGFLISKDGYILTNNHVVGEADKITVRLKSGKEYVAKKVGYDPKSEVAVIKIEGSEFPFIELGDSGELDIGEWVIAVGNPFGLAETLTVGVVSAKGRSQIGIAEYEDFIQTDAAINPGNSGGPLLNIEGKAIGINTAIFSQTGGYMGIGFAIPINMAKAIKEQLVEKGKVVRGFIGVMLNREEINEEMAKQFGLKKAVGVLIADVVKESPADKSGLKDGDIILKIGDKEIENGSVFRNTVALTAPGTKLNLTIHRDGGEKKIEVTVGNFPDEKETATAAAEVASKLGISVRDLTGDLAQRFGYKTERGVIVAEVEMGGAAARAGVQPGHLIVSVNRKPVTNTDEFEKAIGEAAKDGQVLLRVRDARSSWFVLLKLK